MCVVTSPFLVPVFLLPVIAAFLSASGVLVAYRYFVVSLVCSLPRLYVVQLYVRRGGVRFPSVFGVLVHPRLRLPHRGSWD